MIQNKIFQNMKIPNLMPRIKLNSAKAVVHPTAIVDSKAWLAEGVHVGPYCVIGPNVKIGRDTILHSHVVIDGWTTIGERNDIYSGVCLGTPPQVKGFRELSRPALVIGDDNVLREYVTISPSTNENVPTRIGNRNLLMIQAHVGHDGILGDDIMIANAAGLSGHVTVEDKVVIGGLTGIHQFVRIGKLAMIGGVSRVTKDIPPFSICAGSPIRLYGINSVGLRRNGYSSAQAILIRKAMRTLFMRGAQRAEAVAHIRLMFKGNPEVEHLAIFCEKSKRGIARLSMDAREGEGVENVEIEG